MSGGPLIQEDAWVSIEVMEFASEAGAAVGDRLTLLIGADPLEVTVKSIRAVDWQSMRPTGSPCGLSAQSARGVPGYVYDQLRDCHHPSKNRLLNRCSVRALPTVTVIELDIVIREMRAVVDQVARALELVLGVILMAGGLVLISGVRSSLDGRLREEMLCFAGEWAPAKRVYSVGVRSGLSFWCSVGLAGLAGWRGRCGGGTWGLQTCESSP